MTETELEGLSDLEIQRLQHRQKLDQECENDGFNISELPTEQQGSEFVLTEENKAVILAIAKLDPSGRKHWSHLHRIAYNEVESFVDGSYPCGKTAYNSAVLLMTSDVLTPEQKQEVKNMAAYPQQDRKIAEEPVKTSEQYIPTEEEVYQSWKNKIKKLATNKAELYFQSQPQELLQSAYSCHESEVLRLLKQHYKTLLIFKAEFPSGVIICNVPTWNIAVSCYLSYTLLWDSLIKEILDVRKISKTNESVNTEII